MLHGITGKRNSYLVQFFVRVRNLEIFFEQIDDVRRCRSNILSFRCTAAWHNDANLGVMGASLSGWNYVHWTYRYCNQVARQRLCFRKFHGLKSLAASSFRERRSVGESATILGNVQRNLPRHLVAGLIEAGKCPSRRDVFKLRVDVPALSI